MGAAQDAVDRRDADLESAIEVATRLDGEAWASPAAMAVLVDEMHEEGRLPMVVFHPEDAFYQWELAARVAIVERAQALLLAAKSEDDRYILWRRVFHASRRQPYAGPPPGYGLELRVTGAWPDYSFVVHMARKVFRRDDYADPSGERRRGVGGYHHERIFFYGHERVPRLLRPPRPPVSRHDRGHEPRS